MADFTHFVQYTYIEKIDSTNRFLQRMAEKGFRSDMLVRSDYQSNGSGYDQNGWESEPGKNALFSLLWNRPQVEIANQFLLSKIVCLAVYHTVKSYAPMAEVKIKWPNDIYVGDRKLAGILITHQVMGMQLDYSIIGIGINVNQDVFHSDAPNPVSMKQLIGAEVAPHEIMQAVVLKIERLIELLPHEEDIHQEFHHLLYGLNEEKRYWLDNKVQLGVVEGVDEYGRLKLRVGKELVLADFKQVKLILD